MFTAQQLKSDFPILSRQVHGKPLVYLDNAATSQKPEVVISAIVEYYRTANANVHRGVHQLSEESTNAWEKSRVEIARFFGALPEELILTRNTTEGLNAVGYGWADEHLQAGDIILCTEMEHHSNLVVWQQVCQRTGAELQFLEVDEQGRLLLESFSNWLKNPKLKLLAVTHVSNTLGTRNPVEEMITQLKSSRSDVKVVIDAAQSAPHLLVDFHLLDADFVTFSGHKMLGPMGVGGLLVKKTLLSSGEFKPWLFGGGMISEVALQKTVFAEDLADRFTAGTPDVASAVGLAAACHYLSTLSMKAVEAQDQALVAYALEKFSQVPELRVIGPTKAEAGKALDRVGSVAFIYDGVHAHDVAQVLDSEGIAVRSGHHCTMPLHVKFNWQASVRVSFQIYNSSEDIDAVVAALDKVKTVFKR